MKKLKIETSEHNELLDITPLIVQEIEDNFSGSLLLYTPHTTAAITINEGADPDVLTDITGFLDNLIPWENPNFDHREGNSAAHIKAMIVGNDQMVIVESGKLQLGMWERVYFCEFDGPRKREIWLQHLG